MQSMGRLSRERTLAFHDGGIIRLLSPSQTSPNDLIIAGLDFASAKSFQSKSFCNIQLLQLDDFHPKRSQEENPWMENRRSFFGCPAADLLGPPWASDPSGPPRSKSSSRSSPRSGHFASTSNGTWRTGGQDGTGMGQDGRRKHIKHTAKLLCGLVFSCSFFPERTWRRW